MRAHFWWRKEAILPLPDLWANFIAARWICQAKSSANNELRDVRKLSSSVQVLVAEMTKKAGARLLIGLG